MVDALNECRDCGLLQRLPSVQSDSPVVCVRCDATLRRVRRFSPLLVSSCAVIGIALLGLALVLPAAAVSMPGGRSGASRLLSGPHFLKETGAPGLSVAVVLPLLVLPALRLAAAAAMALCVCFGRAPTWARKAFTIVSPLRTWAMVDVFLLGALIALFRLRASMDVSFGSALFALAGVAVCSLVLDAGLDRWAFWQRFPVRETALEQARMALIGCRHCGRVSCSKEGAPCARCGRKLMVRRPYSVSRTWALLIAAAILLLPANLLPVITAIKLGQGEPMTILEGITDLRERGLWVASITVLVTSIAIPILKLAALSVLLVMTRRRMAFRLRLRTKVFRFLHAIVRWSMTEVFAAMTLVALARFGWLTSVLPGPGATAFCAVVFLTMWAADSFDPRLMWDAAGKNPGQESDSAQNSEAFS